MVGLYRPAANLQISPSFRLTARLRLARLRSVLEKSLRSQNVPKSGNSPHIAKGIFESDIREFEPSGSTGDPKGVEIAGNFLASVRPYMRFGLDLQATDTFWPTGDPGWGYGLVCCHAALSMGVPVLSYEGAPTPEAALQLVQEHKVSNLATVPTVLRGIMALGAHT